jgi:glycosyltransferase involved in cell wall biosynthesis
VKILNFILDHRVGGPHVYVKTVGQALHQKFESFIVTTGKGPMTDMALTNLRHRSKLLYPIEIIFNIFRICWKFRKRADRIAVIFDVHGAVNIAPIFAARLLRIPVVWHFHETHAVSLNLVKFGKLALSAVPHRYAVVAIKSAIVFELPSPHLIPGALDLTFWRPRRARNYQMRSRGCKLRLIVVGNLNPLKGIDILLDALNGLNIPLEIVIVGAELSTHRSYAISLYERAARLVGYGHRVEFVGWQSRENIRDLFGCVDIFVLPSRAEASPIALMEAMAMEVACVASAVGDVERILRAEGCGVVFPSESIDELRAALIHTASLGEIGRAEMGRRARAHIAAEYSLETMAERHLELYSELTGYREELN